MAAKALPPVALLRQLLRYEPVTGKLFWLRRTRETCAMLSAKNSASAATVRAKAEIDMGYSPTHGRR